MQHILKYCDFTRSEAFLTALETLLSWEAAIPVMGLRLSQSKAATSSPFGIVWAFLPYGFYRQGTDAKNSEDSYEMISKVSACYISAIFLPRVAKVVSASQQLLFWLFRLATSKTTTDFGLY